MDSLIKRDQCDKNLPLVTIGIPTYNRVRGLKHTIQCALSQSYQNIEIIVADNCTEKKEEIDTVMLRYAENKKIRYYRHTKNYGPAYNFEFIMKNANGEFCIFFTDDDDYNNPNMIDAGVRAFMRNPSAVLAYGYVEYIDKTNTAFIRDDVPYKLDGSLFSRIKNYLINDITDHLMYGLFRTSVARNYSFERDVFTAEKFFLLYLLANGPVCDAPGMGYRNIYSFKTPAEVQACLGFKNRKNFSLMWYKKFFEYLPLIQALFFSFLYTIVRAPKISWPIRKIFRLPKKLPGRFIDP